MSILVFSGSLRKDSLNKKLAREAARVLVEEGFDARFEDLKPLEMPVYDGDLEEASGVPERIRNFGEKVEKASAIVVATPEYNGGISSALKTLADWLSRLDPVPIEGKPLLLIGASPGALGAVRGLWHTRVPFEALGVHVYPEMMGLPRAADAFDPEGKIKDEKTAKKLRTLLLEFLEHGRVTR